MTEHPGRRMGPSVVAPVAGRVLPMTEVPDPVFAGEMVGPGLAIDPPRERLEAVAPVTGRLVKVHPHAFVVQTPTGAAVLVHLGIDTVQLKGEGFMVAVSEGEDVEAGQLVVTWDAAAVEAGGRSPVCPVVALEASQVVVDEGVLLGGDVRAGAPLFAIV